MNTLRRSALRRRRIITWSLTALSLWVFSAAASAVDYHSTVVTVTAYNSTEAQTDEKPNLAAWGDRLKPGMHVVAVSPDLVEMGLDHGAQVAIAGFEKPFTVLDRTSSSLTRRVDIYMGEDVEAALEFGRRDLRIWWHTED